MLISLGFIVLLGVPHGSLDVLFASQTYALKHLTQWLKFILYYIVAALAVILLWLVLPKVFFAAFLILSALHFSDDLNANSDVLNTKLDAFNTKSVHLNSTSDGLDPKSDGLNSKFDGLNLKCFAMIKWSYGAAIITLPSLFFGAELIHLYAMLIDTETANRLVAASQFIGLSAALILTIGLFKQHIEARTKLEILTVCALFLFITPLLAFGVYFCFMHSARHLIRSHFFLKQLSKQAFLSALILPTIAVIIMGLVTWQIGASKTLDVTLIRIIFVGLAALTVPHAWVLKQSNFQAWVSSRNERDLA
jgi:Brp/Blh family beta-carotene 15,15'-monooxygenase